jgi:two-component system, LuxR family, sensor kinase FixL
VGRISRGPDLPVYSVGVHQTATGTTAGLAPTTERVFRPLVTTCPEGVGIGLSMSRIIVEMHGGRLWATPNAGGAGATFHLTLLWGHVHG